MNRPIKKFTKIELDTIMACGVANNLLNTKLYAKYTGADTYEVKCIAVLKLCSFLISSNKCVYVSVSDPTVFALTALTMHNGKNTLKM